MPCILLVSGLNSCVLNKMERSPHSMTISLDAIKKTCEDPCTVIRKSKESMPCARFDDDDDDDIYCGGLSDIVWDILCH